MNSKLSVRKIEKHEIRILSYDGGLKDVSVNVNVNQIFLVWLK